MFELPSSSPVLVLVTASLASVATVAGAWGARPWHLTNARYVNKKRFRSLLICVFMHCQEQLQINCKSIIEQFPAVAGPDDK